MLNARDIRGEYMDILKKENYNFEDLKHIVKILRSENGCPWDAEQTHESIRNNFIEEVYEAAEAIDENNPELLKEELGDVLLQVLMHARISEESGGFDIDGVCDGICKKLILRHPHVFGGTAEPGAADTADKVLGRWENIKIEEKGLTDPQQYLKNTPKTLPALMRAEKIYKRAVKSKLIKPKNIEKKSVKHAINVLNTEINGNIETNAFETLGRIFFELAGLSSELGINPEQALYFYTEQFIKNLSTK